MNLLPSFRLTMSFALSAVLVGCAGTEEVATPTVVRTPAPQGYEKTIANYLAFRIRGPQKNAEINVGAPEPGACALDGYSSSVRGWVVPVAYATRTGTPAGPVEITAKQYYFWFLGETIAGITPRIELCPGVGTMFGEFAPASAAPAVPAMTTLPAPAKSEAPDRVEAGTAKKSGASSGATKRGAKKAGGARGKAKAPSKRPRAQPSQSR